MTSLTFFLLLVTLFLLTLTSVFLHSLQLWCCSCTSCCLLEKLFFSVVPEVDELFVYIKGMLVLGLKDIGLGLETHGLGLVIKALALTLRPRPGQT